VCVCVCVRIIVYNSHTQQMPPQDSSDNLPSC